MPRVGGESDKLGNRYEGIWTVDSLLGVLAGEVRSITVEPLMPAAGVEFLLRRVDGVKDYHSVKRQTTQPVWSLAKLTELSATGRSFLGDLFEKITADTTNHAAFVSSTTAQALEELREIAHASPDVANFEQRLSAQPRLRESVVSYVLPLLGDSHAVWAVLRRLRVVGITEPELILRVDQRIRFALYRPDGAAVEPEAVRLALGEGILNWLGVEVTSTMARDFLAERGWRERDWQRDTTLREHVDKRNRAYAAAVEAELIHGASIPRKEADEAVKQLLESTQHVVIIGAAGLGKSCATAQVVHTLEGKSIPHLTLRLDIQTMVLTADALGRELGLPMSPTVVLAGLARGGLSVLVIDQLDALSLVSGRNQHLWAVFEELMTESSRYPQMRVLLACREFDAANDHRLKRLIADDTRCKKITLAPLDVAQVTAAVTRAGVDPAKLSAHDILLLQTPQNLSLFLQSGPREHGQVGSVQALLNRYWDYKRRIVEARLGRPVRWLDVVKTLASWLSDHQTLSAPVDVLDAVMADAQAMASEHVLVIERNSCRFFHESVFDYVFARTFVAEGGTVMRLLEEDEQDLFRRGQVRQILTYNRDRAFDEYLADLKSLLSDPAIRTHIKKVVIDWLRNLRDPRSSEWDTLRSLAHVSPVTLWWRTIPYGSVGWFDLLVECETWQEWLRSPDESVVDQATWQLGQAAVMRERSEKVAELFEPLLHESPAAIGKLRKLLRFGEPHHSRRMFDLFLRAVRKGWLDEPGDHWWHHLHDFPDKAPTQAAELLAAFIDRQVALRPEGDPFPQRGQEFRFPVDFCPRLAKAAPDEFIARVLPRIATEIVRRIAPGASTRDLVWRYTTCDEAHPDFNESLLAGLALAATNLAKISPARFSALTMEAQKPIKHSLGLILLPGWAANPEILADEGVAYLCADPSRLKIGYDITSASGGSGPGYVSRETIRAIAPHCSAPAFAQLETAILRFRNPHEAAQQSGYYQLRLLACLPDARLGAAARNRLDELRRKFPTVEEDIKPKPLAFEAVPSPIEPSAMTKMTTENWISAMRTYGQGYSRTVPGRLGGGIHELTSELRHETQKDRPRYAALLLALPDDIDPEYFRAILWGLVDNQKLNSSDRGDFPPLEMEILVRAIRRVEALPGRKCGQAICHAIGRSAGRALPDELLELLCDYAINDPHPKMEDWQDRTDGRPALWGGDPMMSGMNSVRGSGAWAIGSILFANAATWPKLQTAVEALVVDKSIAVRACAVRCLLALLNCNRKLAVDLFVKLADGADPVLATGEINNFIHHGIYPHYAELRPLLLHMLQHSEKEARAMAAQQIAVASFGPAKDDGDLAQAMAAGADCRAACAGVFAHNLDDASAREVCREKLKSFFHDPEKEVRDQAASCFRGLGEGGLTQEAVLIGEFIQSPAFVNGNSQLMFELAETCALLPDVICAIPERIIALHVSSPANDLRFDCYQLPELVLRLYRQTKDAAIRKRCLDTIDRMLEFSIGDIDTELGKVER